MSFPSPEFMRMALRLARKGIGRTSPNPSVGAVIALKGRVVGKGFHRAAGLPHAEIEAIRDAGKAARGADLYITLEPCCHFGRTGPCTDEISSAGIRRVAAAMKDPNPLVAGKGIAELKKSGIRVETGLFEEEARALNRPYLRWIVSGKPYVTLKLAISIDGRIAAAGGSSRWISGEPARKIVHRMRGEADAVLVGGETFRRDDPLLTSRIRGGKDPKRIVLTSRLSGLSAKRLLREGRGEVIFVCPRGAPLRDAESAASLGARVIGLPAPRGKISAETFLHAIGKEGITSLLVEGGGKTAGWLAAAGAVDRFVFFIAPLLLGDGVPALSGFRAGSISGGKKIEIIEARRLGSDLMVTAQPAERSGK